MPPKSDITPSALARWETLRLALAGHAHFEYLVEDLAESLPLPTGKPRQKSRVREWFEADGVLPNAAYVLHILSRAKQYGMITDALWEDVLK